MADDILYLTTHRYLMFRASFETRSAMQFTISTALGRFRKVFAVEMAQEFTQHCQDKNAGILWTDMERVYANGFLICRCKWPQSQIDNGTDTCWGWRTFQQTWASCLRSRPCSIARITGFNRMQCQKCVKNLRNSCKENMHPMLLLQLSSYSR